MKQDSIFTKESVSLFKLIFRISTKCHLAYNETNKDICNCAKQTYIAKKSEFENDYSKCSGAASPLMRYMDTGLIKSAQYHGSGVEFMVTSLCKQPDLHNQKYHKGREESLSR